MKKHLLRCAGVVSILALSAVSAFANPRCITERPEPLLPKDQALCASLEAAIRTPEALPLNEYEAKLAEFLRNWCHRSEANGWVSDKRLRDTGPFIGLFQNGKWTGSYHGTHAPVVVWYSPDMVAWLKENRPEAHGAAAAEEKPVPDGAIMVKEMFPPPTSACAGVNVERLYPESGAAIMVRAAGASHDGWFWGWFGWDNNIWAPSWPANAGNGYQNMGFGLYCTNCHSSARANQTFAALRNIAGEPGEPLVYLSHDYFLAPHFQEGGRAMGQRRVGAVPELEGFLTHHEEVARLGLPRMGARQAKPYNQEFTKLLQLLEAAPPSTAASLPSETYDHVWMPAGKATAKSQFVTSDQCLGCHDAGGTGLQFQMTAPGEGGKLANISPYATWRTSPMGLAGRDPVFFAQLASETETFHPESSALVQDTCLGCHAVQGHRQHAIDKHAETGQCAQFARATLDAVPYPPGKDEGGLAHYAALGRDGVACNACHGMVLGEKARVAAQSEPQNACVRERQERFNAGLTGLASTFTGSFLLAEPGKLFGPYEDPKDKPMQAAIGLVPEHGAHMKASEICASCHTVHLPVLHQGKVIGHAYEQATYPEWAFSAYREGKTEDGPLPLGPGAKAQSCQSCHMPSKDARGRPYETKIATIQEYSNFPQAEYTLPPEDIDLPERKDFAKHTLVGLNLFLIRIAKQFPNVLGLRSEDPMLPPSRGTNNLSATERAILTQAAESTAEIAIADIDRDANALSATVRIVNKAGHKFPSGVAFRRAFIAFEVLDASGVVLWSSGRINGAGVIVDEKGAAVAGELWWTPDCSARIAPEARAHQPHYQAISRQDQVQIYQEISAAPGEGEEPSCGAHAAPTGPLTTSFLSLCAKAKDNRLLPDGFLPLADRIEIATALGAEPDLAEEVTPAGVGDDPDYVSGGGDSIRYRIPLAGISGEPAELRARLYYQAMPPYYLQDRFCTARSADTKRLYYLAGKLDTASGPIQGWKLQVGNTASAEVPQD